VPVVAVPWRALAASALALPGGAAARSAPATILRSE